MTRLLLVAVVGPGDNASQAELELAEQVGYLLADRGIVVVTGGLGGVMAAACRGAVAAGGMTLGYLPGPDPSAANEFVRMVIPTDLGETRNALVVHSCNALIAIGQSWGTLAEVALAMRIGRACYTLTPLEVATRMTIHEAATVPVTSPTDAVEQAANSASAFWERG